MEPKPDKPDTRERQLRTQRHLDELRMMREGECIFWLRQSPSLKRDITIYREMLTPEQQQRLDAIEKELLEMAYDAEEETRTKTVLKGKKPPEDKPE